MTYSRESAHRSWRLVWVGVIALVAATITTWLRTESIVATLVFGLASAVISMAVVWTIDRVSGPR